MKKLFNQIFKELRSKNHLTQAQAAIILNVSKNVIYRWEANKSKPKLRNIIAIARYFNVTANYLLGLDNE